MGEIARRARELESHAFDEHSKDGKLTLAEYRIIQSLCLISEALGKIGEEATGKNDHPLRL